MKNIHRPASFHKTAPNSTNRRLYCDYHLIQLLFRYRVYIRKIYIRAEGGGCCIAVYIEGGVTTKTTTNSPSKIQLRVTKKQRARACAAAGVELAYRARERENSQMQLHAQRHTGK